MKNETPRPLCFNATAVVSEVPSPRTARRQKHAHPLPLLHRRKPLSSVYTILLRFFHCSINFIV